MRQLLTQSLGGLGLGYALARIGFADFGEVHRMFTLADPRLILTFAAAVGLTGLGFALLPSVRGVDPRPFHPGVLRGSVLFGLGWAITGACPGVVLVQLGQGHLAALATLVGMLLGAWAWGRVEARSFREDPQELPEAGGCEQAG